MAAEANKQETPLKSNILPIFSHPPISVTLSLLFLFSIIPQIILQ